MIIALIYWKIKPGCEKNFFEFWKTKAVVHDRAELMGEFLSAPVSPEELDYITWKLRCDDDIDHIPFVNIGLWADAQAFHDQIAVHFNDEGIIEPFEAARRVRTILRPQEWRLGDKELPIHDSGGVM